MTSRPRRARGPAALLLRSLWRPAAPRSGGSRRPTRCATPASPRRRSRPTSSILAEIGDGPLPDLARAAAREGAQVRRRDQLSGAGRLRRRHRLLPPDRLAPAGDAGGLRGARRHRRHLPRALQRSARRHRAVRRRRGARRARRRAVAAQGRARVAGAEELRAGPHGGRSRCASAGPPRRKADEAQLLTAQAWALEGRPRRRSAPSARSSERRPSQELVARALEGQALLYRTGEPLRPGARALRAGAAHPSEPRGDPHRHRGGESPPRRVQDRPGRETGSRRSTTISFRTCRGPPPPRRPPQPPSRRPRPARRRLRPPLQPRPRPRPRYPQRRLQRRRPRRRAPAPIPRSHAQ